jgi:hypothetical protein
VCHQHRTLVGIRCMTQPSPDSSRCTQIIGGSVDRWIGGSVDRWIGGSVAVAVSFKPPAPRQNSTPPEQQPPSTTTSGHDDGGHDDGVDVVGENDLA